MTVEDGIGDDADVGLGVGERSKESGGISSWAFEAVDEAKEAPRQGKVGGVWIRYLQLRCRFGPLFDVPRYQNLSSVILFLITM